MDIDSDSSKDALEGLELSDLDSQHLCKVSTDGSHSQLKEAEGNRLDALRQAPSKESNINIERQQKRQPAFRNQPKEIPFKTLIDCKCFNLRRSEDQA